MIGQPTSPPPPHRYAHDLQNAEFAEEEIVRQKYLISTRNLRSFVIRFDFESYVRFEIRFVVMVRFEIFETSALSIVIRKETIGGG